MDKCLHFRKELCIQSMCTLTVLSYCTIFVFSVIQYLGYNPIAVYTTFEIFLVMLNDVHVFNLPSRFKNLLLQFLLTHLDASF